MGRVRIRDRALALGLGLGLGLGFWSAHPVALVVRLGRVGDGVGGHEPNLVRVRIGVRAGARLGLRLWSEIGRR